MFSSSAAASEAMPFPERSAPCGGKPGASVNGEQLTGISSLVRVQFFCSAAASAGIPSPGRPDNCLRKSPASFHAIGQQLTLAVSVVRVLFVAKAAAS